MTNIALHIHIQSVNSDGMTSTPVNGDKPSYSGMVNIIYSVTGIVDMDQEFN